MASGQQPIEVQDVVAKRQDPDDPQSLLDLQITLTCSEDGRETVLFEWEAEIEDAEETTVRTVENEVNSAVERVVGDDEFRLPDDQSVLGVRLRQALGQRGIEVEP